MINFIKRLISYIPIKNTITDLQITKTSESESYWLTYTQVSFGIKHTKTLYGSYNKTYNSAIWYNDNYVMVQLPDFDPLTSGSHYNLLTTILK